MAQTPTYPKYCLMFKVTWGILSVVRVPEEHIPMNVRHGWSVLITDSEMPPNPWDPKVDVEGD